MFSDPWSVVKGYLETGGRHVSVLNGVVYEAAKEAHVYPSSLLSHQSQRRLTSIQRDFVGQVGELTQDSAALMAPLISHPSALDFKPQVGVAPFSYPSSRKVVSNTYLFNPDWMFFLVTSRHVALGRFALFRGSELISEESGVELHVDSVSW